MNLVTSTVRRTVTGIAAVLGIALTTLLVGTGPALAAPAPDPTQAPRSAVVIPVPTEAGTSSGTSGWEIVSIAAGAALVAAVLTFALMALYRVLQTRRHAASPSPA